MDDNTLNTPEMILIGSAGRNSGKTTLAIEIIRKLKNDFNIIGLKVTTVQERNGKCPRGGKGCGVCSNIKGNFEILEETNKTGSKDTSCLLEAGAEKVYWLKTFKSHIYEGINEFMKLVPKNTLIICESNSLRNVVNPGVFIMINNELNINMKKSASEVIQKADTIIDYDFIDNINYIINKIRIITDENGIIKNSFYSLS